MIAALLLPLILAPTTLRVGRSQVDITPDVPLPLGGYTERGFAVSQPGGDHLYVRTIAFQGGQTRIAVASVETLTIPESLVREVKKRIPQDVALFLAATHTHSAPDSQMLNDRMTFFIPGIAGYQAKWLTWYADKIASSVKEALSAGANVGSIYVDEAHADFNIGRRKFADPDQTVTEVSAFHPMFNGAGEPLILEYAAHGTVYGAKNLKTRGDWPGIAANVTGAEVIQGAIGDVLPKDWGPTPEQSIAKIVKGLTGALAKGHEEDVWKPGLPIAATNVAIPLEPIKPHPTMAKSYGVKEDFAEKIVKQFAPPQASITAFRLGKLAVVGVPGEPTSILGRQIRDAGLRMGFKSVLVCSHVNGWMGYILDPEDYDRGGYEATLSFYGREEGAKVVQAGIQALRALSGKR